MFLKTREPHQADTRAASLVARARRTWRVLPSGQVIQPARTETRQCPVCNQHKPTENFVRSTCLDQLVCAGCHSRRKKCPVCRCEPHGSGDGAAADQAAPHHDAQSGETS